MILDLRGSLTDGVVSIIGQGAWLAGLDVVSATLPLVVEVSWSTLLV